MRELILGTEKTQVFTLIPTKMPKRGIATSMWLARVCARGREFVVLRFRAATAVCMSARRAGAARARFLARVSRLSERPRGRGSCLTEELGDRRRR